MTISNILGSKKMLIRSPAMTLLMFLLFGTVAFALFSQTAEYAIMARELNSAAGMYRGVGTVEADPPDVPVNAGAGIPFHLSLEGQATGRYKPLTHEQLAAVSALPYVSSVEARYMTAGVSEDYFRMDDGEFFFDFAARAVIEGNVYKAETTQTFDTGRSVTIQLSEATTLAGRPTAIGRSGSGALIGFVQYATRPAGFMGSISIGHPRAFVIEYSGHDYGSGQIEALENGKRYVFIVRVEVVEYTTFINIGDYLSDDWCDAILPLEDVADDYLELEEFAPLRELIEITNADARTFDMVYTQDMGSIIKFNERNMVVVDGRELTVEDSLTDANVCVVSFEFARKYSVGIGDTITMKLGEKLFEQYLNLGAVAGSRQRYEPPGEEVTLEVVGIWASTESESARSREPHFGYSINTIFVPMSLLQVDEAKLYGHEFVPSEFSFVVDNAWDIAAFLDESGPLIEEMGLTLIFSDGGWLGIAEEFTMSRQLSLIRMSIFLLAVVVASCLGVYLFIGRRKKDYAIMRALGTPAKASAKALLFPLMAVAVTSIAVGGAAAWTYTARTIESNNALVLLQEFSVDKSVPAWVFACSLLGQLLLTLALALAMLRRIGQQSPLSLLQSAER